MKRHGGNHVEPTGARTDVVEMNPDDQLAGRAWGDRYAGESNSAGLPDGWFGHSDFVVIKVWNGRHDYVAGQWSFTMVDRVGCEFNGGDGDGFLSGIVKYGAEGCVFDFGTRRDGLRYWLNASDLKRWGREGVGSNEGGDDGAESADDCAPESHVAVPFLTHD